jgi:hypothetical protein
MEKETRFNDEQICFVQMQKDEHKLLDTYIFNEENQTITPVADVFKEQPEETPVKEKDGELWVDENTKVLRLSTMIDERGWQGTLEFFKKHFSQPAYNCFFNNIFNKAVGEGVEASKLAKVSTEIMRSQLDHKTPAQNREAPEETIEL